MTAPVIREIEERDEARWRELWAGYLSFYRQSLTDDITTATWARMRDSGSGMLGSIAVVEGRAAGFAICVLHACTWTTRPICYLEDLFVDPASRGRGVGQALIEDVLRQARENGWSRVYWHTDAGNAPARALYDRFAPADGFVRYRMFPG